MTALLRSCKGHVTLALAAILLLTAVLLVAQRWSVDSAVTPALLPPPPPPALPRITNDDEAMAPPPALPRITNDNETIAPPSALPPIQDDDEAMAAALFGYLENPERCCRKLTMFGGVQTKQGIDGDKFVCLDAAHAPPPGACLVYSVGISNEWSFDRDMVSYGCELHCFDPSMTKYNRKETEFGAKFYKIGLGGRTEVQSNGWWADWQMMTLTDIRRKLGHTERDIHYLKVDIEGSEWGWLENDAQSLRGVHQLGMEVHMDLQPAKLRKHYAVFRTIQEAGFALIHVNVNRVHGRKFQVAGVRGKVSSLYELVWMRA